MVRDPKRRRPGKRNTYATSVALDNPGKPTVVKSIRFLAILEGRADSDPRLGGGWGEVK